MSEELDYQRINERVEESVKRDKRLAKYLPFVINAVLFVIVLVIGWQIYLGNGGSLPGLDEIINLPEILRSRGNPTTAALLILCGGWALALLFQGVVLIIDTPFGERAMRDKAMEREIRKEMTRMRLAEQKAPEKRKGMMRLTDDGELEAIDDVVEIDVTPIKQYRKV